MEEGKKVCRDHPETTVNLPDKAREELKAIPIEPKPVGDGKSKTLEGVVSEKYVILDITNVAAWPGGKTQEQDAYYGQQQYDQKQQGQKQYGQQQYSQQQYPQQQNRYGQQPGNNSSQRQQNYGNDNNQGHHGLFSCGNRDDQRFTSSFNTVQIRNRFVRRVYMILCVQLFFTFGFALSGVFIVSMRRFFIRYWWIMLIGSALYLITYVVLICCQKVRRNFPVNFICLAILTLGLTLVFTCVAAKYGHHILLYAIGSGSLLVLIISLVAWQTKWDVTGCGCCLCILGLLLGIFGIIAILLTYFLHLRIMMVVYAFLAVGVFSVYLMYDTQMVLGGRRYELEPEEYIAGAVTLYSDVVMIIMELMHIFGYFNE